MAYCSDGSLYATDNGPDQRDGTLLFRPPDEVNRIEEGSHYGYPDVFGFAPPGSGVTSPVALLPMSGAAAGIVCYEDGTFPPEYGRGLFVALWGTLVVEREHGRRVMWIDLASEPVADARLAVEFAAGFGHPIDLLQTPDGSLLVLDYDGGLIYRIAYP